MPLTRIGKRVKRSMMKRYGKKAGARVFFASENKRIAGSSKWTKAKRKTRRKR